MKFRSLVLVGAIALLTGCAAGGPKYSETAAKIPVLNSEQGRVFFYRPNTFAGAALQPSIMLDGKKVGDSKPGGFFYVDLTPGSHSASTSTEVSNKLSFVLDKGEVKYVRTKVSMGLMVGHVIPELVSPNEAKTELVETSYTGGAPQ